MSDEVSPEPAEPSFDDQVGALALLSEPVRRSLYLHVASCDHDVSRDEAAGAVGIDRSLAAFHLDKLVERGLLEVTYRRLTGRSGPGSGRPAKLYRRSSRQHEVSLPPRQYELAARLLAEGLEGPRPGHRSVAGAAKEFGRSIGRSARSALRPRAGRERRMAAMVDALGRHGYEPERAGGAVVLRNCPFHGLTDRHRQLVCGMNFALLQGFLEGMEADDLEARPESQPGHCCVTLSPNQRRS